VTVAPAPFWADASIARRRDGGGARRVRVVARLRQAPEPALRPLPRAAATAAILAHAPFLEGIEPPLQPAPIAQRIASSVRVAELDFGKNPSFWRVLDASLESR
jgi:hypothetical protein